MCALQKSALRLSDLAGHRPCWGGQRYDASRANVRRFVVAAGGAAAAEMEMFGMRAKRTARATFGRRGSTQKSQCNTLYESKMFVCINNTLLNVLFAFAFIYLLS